LFLERNDAPRPRSLPAVKASRVNRRYAWFMAGLLGGKVTSRTLCRKEKRKRMRHPQIVSVA
jgi:hypothetical protein